MTDRDQIKRINDLCHEILSLNDLYKDASKKFYFHYFGVIDLLEKAKREIEDSLRCARPDNLPSDIQWSDKTDPDYEFNPLVYDGSISIDDYEKAQKEALKNIQKKEGY